MISTLSVTEVMLQVATGYERCLFPGFSTLAAVKLL